ncbi:MAG: T9SS type A sorting domain-containing protein [Bacteroidota bacterium]|nr:T9SS type A sorting domain-containing protein [Bacteroidota bacterium]
MKHRLYTLLMMLLLGSAANMQAQCPFDPTVTGDSLLCPNDTGLLSTQVYDSYQWYKRPLFGGTAQIIPGATFQTLTIDAFNDAANYFSVEATLNGCSETSPEVLVDSWLFLFPYTIIEGDYTIGSMGELILCQGDTILLISGMPYDTNLQWYDNGNPIAGANNDTLFVTTAGSYTYSGAPSICPNYIQNQFIPSDVTVITCPTGLVESPGYEVGIMPNPANDLITVSFPGCESIAIFDATGRKVASESTRTTQTLHTINVSSLARGVYTVRVQRDGIFKGAILMKN